MTKARNEPIDKYSGIRADLLRQRHELIQAGMAGIHSGSPSERSADLSDQASAQADQHLELTLKERDQKVLRDIQAALMRLNEKNFGMCEDCGEEIPYKRLLARPTSRLCVPCQTDREKDNKLRELPSE